MTRGEIMTEITEIIFYHPVDRNSRLCRQWRKAHMLNDKKLNNLLKRYRLHKIINASL